MADEQNELEKEMSSIASRVKTTHPMQTKYVSTKGTAPVMATPLAVGAGLAAVAAAFTGGLLIGANAG